MRDRFRIVVVLLICGTLCILGPVIVLAILFDNHAAILSQANKHETPVHVTTFLFFVVVPSVLAMLGGAGWN